MSCNCTTEEQLKQIYAKFGTSNMQPKDGKLSSRIAFYSKKVLLVMLMLIITPLLFAYVFYKFTIGDGKISFRKFFGLKEAYSLEEYYYAKQQEHQDKN